MAKKQILFKTKGMNRDLSVSAFNPEFAFENINLRLSTNEGNTLLSWVNEKGTLQITGENNAAISLEGTPIGTAIIDHKLVVFTTKNKKEKYDSTANDYIYVLEYADGEKTKMTKTELYNGKLNFYTGAPLETLVSYEAVHIQKVYWTDGRNQPRMINIKGTIKPGKNTQFDFVPNISKGNITLEKTDSSSGIFAPGVIQYCFTYINKYGQESNVVDVTSLQYLSLSTRGAAPDEKVSSSFKLVIGSLDDSFDAIKLYSIQRTSLDSEPFVKLLGTILLSEADSNGNINFVDNGMLGATIDPLELLYVGGKEILALTMADKDGTLFLGNIEQKDILVDNIQKYFDDNRGNIQITYSNDKEIELPEKEGLYPYKSQLKNNSSQITTFKGGETYRFGFQLQKKTGEWTEPIYIKNEENTKYPVYDNVNNKVKVAQASYTVPLSGINNFEYDKFKSIRPVIVYPTIGERAVLCQGVLNPTVFNVEDRVSNSPSAQASWYFRPYADVEAGNPLTEINKNIDVTPHALNESEHVFPVVYNDELFSNSLTTVYVMVASVSTADLANITSTKEIKALTIAPNESSESGNFSGRRSYKNYSVYGIIDLNKTDGTNKYYAFLSTSPWDYQISDTVLGTISYEGGVNYKGTTDVPFVIYSGLKTTTEGFLYYLKEDSNDPDSFIFKFYTNEDLGNYYEIKFNTVSTEKVPSTYIEATVHKVGNSLRYTHYDSLFTEDDLKVKDESGSTPVYKELQGKDLLDGLKNVEIQGSARVYETPFSSERFGSFNKLAGRRGQNTSEEVRERSFMSNTQFFVDQSIVTLNSPDIEFDTEVQSVPSENWKLRVVGCIPITACASSHSIKTSSGMLDVMHNNNNGNSTKLFGMGELAINVLHYNKTSHTDNRLVSEYFWNDVLVKDAPDIEDENDRVIAGGKEDFLVYPWQRTGSLNNDSRPTTTASSVLKTKKESNLLFSSFSNYIKEVDMDKVEMQIHLTENDHVYNLRLPKQLDESFEINYYPNIDKVLYNEVGYKPRIYSTTANDEWLKDLNSPISMKYKSTSHAVVALGKKDNKIKILPYAQQSLSESEVKDIGKYNGGGSPYWDKNMSLFFDQKNAGKDITQYSFLWMGELYRDQSGMSLFGGETKAAVRSNKWVVAGPSVSIEEGVNPGLVWTEGDTYFQRYDCLKTYAFTPEDTNQIVEILSFMCETHINIDGRYDRNRGQIDNTNMSPVNFNKLNPVYSQRNNYFSYRKTDTEGIEQLVYPNHITFSKTKNSGADVDLWTNVTLASVLEMDGDKGNITSLQRLNNQLICFQDTGISHILYNDNVQIASSTGVPIEIANSGKVQGKDYKSNTIGCSNKWSIVNTPSGIYFMDSNDKSIYLFNGQLQNISQSGGFNTWCKQNIPSSKVLWTPDDFENFVGYYDKLNQDVLWINSMKDADGNETGKALAFSEKLGAFTSFYDYGGSPYFCNLDDTGVWIRKTGDLWKHQAGDYCKFFGVNKPYSMTLVGNPEPQMDKIFTNLEFRACVEDDYTTKTVTEGGVEKTVFDKFLLPFDSLETWNEYQHGIAELKNLNGHALFKHHRQDSNEASLKRKFRIWRCDIPRDNAQVVLPQNPTPEEQKAYDDFIADEHVKGIYRMKAHPVDRMRNPWLYLKLLRNAEQDATKSLGKAEIHDIVMTYFG